MLHIATVHWLDESWIDIQCKYFERYSAGNPYRLYAYLNGIDVEPFKEKFHYISTDPIVAHITKLNLLAEEISRQGAPEDILIFIDGDAFPVSDYVTYVKKHLNEFPIVAVQRLENEGDPQPHPSFCATTIKFWNEIKGDWSKGPKWKTNSGVMRSDTGGVLWKKLLDEKISWKPILRSNDIDIHPLWFGLYGNIVYHHGAAFRTPYCTVDIERAKETLWKKLIFKVADLPAVSRLKGGWVQNAAYSYVMKEIIEKTQKDSQRILQEICENPQFYKQFIASVN